MKRLIVHGPCVLRGRIVVPPDKSVVHRGLIALALGKGKGELVFAAPAALGGDNLSTVSVLSALGVKLLVEPDRVRVRGVGGPGGFRAPDGPLDCGNSGTTMRLMAGVMAASRLAVTFTGDASLLRRPMTRLSPLTAMGASLDGEHQGTRIYPPITVQGAQLTGARHDLEVASAQVKSALLFAGCFAKGETAVHEPMRSRDHTERLLRAFGVPVTEDRDGTVRVQGVARPWKARTLEVPPDLSSAAFLLAAAALTNSPDLRVVAGVNPTRAGFLEVLASMGATVLQAPEPDAGPEPVATLSIPDASGLVGTVVEGELTLRTLDELPLVAAIAAGASGTTLIRDAQELRVKESDRIAQTARMLSAFGARSTETADGLIIEGGPLHPAHVERTNDHRLALTAAVLGLALDGTTEIDGAEVIDVSYPGFVEALRSLGASVDVIEQ